MTASQLQHYVPRFYLEAFAGGPDGVLHVYDKSSGRSFSCSPQRIAAEKSFYDLARIDEEHGDALESALSSLESEVANIFRCWHRQLAQNQLIIPPETAQSFHNTFPYRCCEHLNSGSSCRSFTKKRQDRFTLVMRLRIFIYTSFGIRSSCRK